MRYVDCKKRKNITGRGSIYPETRFLKYRDDQRIAIYAQFPCEEREVFELLWGE